MASARRLPAWPVAAAIIAAGAVLRLAAAGDDFWLDEVWSYFIARELGSPLQVFTAAPIDNNHYLNTLLLYALGVQRDWILYRLPSVLAGIAALPLVWLLLRRFGEGVGTAALLLAAVSYPLVHYSSEARGYALAVFFALASWAAGVRLRDGSAPAAAVALWLAAALGLVSHPTFFLFFPALVLWLSLEVARARIRLGRALAGVAPPAVFALALWSFALSRMVVVGAPPSDLAAVLLSTAAYGAGAPPAGAVALLGATAFVTLAGAGAAWLLRREPGEAVLALAAVALPLAAVAWRRPDFAYPRYFLVGTTFALLLAALALGRLWQAGGWRRTLAAALLGLGLAGNAVHLAQFLRLGRGAYLDCLRFIDANSDVARVEVTGDDLFRNSMMLRFYARYLTPGRRVAYVDADELPPAGVPWLLVHHFDDRAAPAEARDRHGNPYALVRTCPYYGLSGWNWYVYARAGA